MGWFLLFAAAVFGFWFWREYRIQARDQQRSYALPRSGQRYIGQVLTLKRGIENGSGRVKLDNHRWQLRGPDVPAGARVRVTGVDGTILIVDRVPG